MPNIKHFIYDLLIERGLSESTAKYLNMLALLIALLIIAFVVDFITKRILWRFSSGVAKRTKSNFDDILISNKLPRNIAHIIPLFILIEFVPQVFSDFNYAEDIIEKTLKVIDLAKESSSYYSISGVILLPITGVVSGVYVAVNNVYHLGEEKIVCD